MEKNYIDSLKHGRFTVFSFFFNDLTKLKLFHQLQLQFSRWSVQVGGRKGTVETRAYIKIKQDVARYNLPVFQRGFIVLFTRV